MLKAVIASLSVLIALLVCIVSATTFLQNQVEAQEAETPHYREYNFREWYLQSAWQLYGKNPDHFIMSVLYRLNGTYVRNFIMPNTGEDYETAYQRIVSVLGPAPSAIDIHTALTIEAYTAGQCADQLDGQCYLLTLPHWAIVLQVLIPLGGTSVTYEDVKADDYTPEWADWVIPRPSGVSTTPTVTLTPTATPTPIATPQPTATAIAQWNGYGDPGVVAYSGWKNWSDSTSKFRLYVPQSWTIGVGDEFDPYTIWYNSPDRTASALVYEFSELRNPTQADLRTVAMNYVELLKGESDVRGTPTIRSKQNEITGWTEYVIQWEKRPLPGDCVVSGSQFRELWVLGEQGTSDEGRILALELARCKSATTHQNTLNAIESRFQYWR